MGLFQTQTRTAVFSPSRTYRYRLTTVWDVSKPRLVGLFCNPSIANEHRQDNTDRLFRARALELGYGGTVMINMFAIVSTDPKIITEAHDPVGPANDKHILAVCAAHKDVFCGWGLSGEYQNRARNVIKLIKTELRNRNTFYYLRLTQGGIPGHPLYVKKITPLTVWDGY